MRQQILTVGYEGCSPDQFVQLLKRHGVEVLIDVRLTPISRKRGFSKTALSQSLEAAGIHYVHERRLGNPKQIRAESTSIEECLARYELYMEPLWGAALQSTVERASSHRVCLLCVEKDSERCHRSVVSRRLAAYLPHTEVVHLHQNSDP